MLSLSSTQLIAESIGCSPFELVYGEQVRLPVDDIVGNQSRLSNAANIRSAHLAASPGRQESSEASPRLLEALLQ